MNIIICVDDSGGIAFNNRRQSQDRELINKICELTNGSKLWVSSYSQPLFSGYKNSDISTDDDFLKKAMPGEYCFVECVKISEYDKHIQKLILVKWNRFYPSDLKFDLDMSKYKLESKEDIVGNSHEKITLEVYVCEA